MKILFLIIVVTFVYLFVSIQLSTKPKATNAGVILKDMAEEEVIANIGEPYFKRETYWWYPDRKFIYFENGKVTGATLPLAFKKGQTPFFEEGGVYE